MAITKIRENQQRISRGSLDPVKTVGESNIDVATGGLIAVGGYTLQDGDRVLLIGQTVATEDGIYLARAGAWERDEDAEVGDDIGSALLIVEEGSFAGQLWQIGNTRGAGVVGTDDLTAAEHEIGSGAANRVFGEEPAVTNNDPTVTLANTPTAGTLRVYLNGLRQNEGGSDDYTVSGAVVTFNFDLKNSAGRVDVVVADYEY